MDSPSSRSSPSFKNVKLRQKHSPIELKEKLRKSYKEKIHNCRSLIFNSFRGNLGTQEIKKTLDDIYQQMFGFHQDELTDEEDQILAEIHSDLVKQELDWWLEEYEKCQNDNNFDWSILETENVICPVCQKENLTKENNLVKCNHCKCTIQTDKTLKEVKEYINKCVDRHGINCCGNFQFSYILDNSNFHLFFICDMCNDFQLVL